MQKMNVTKTFLSPKEDFINYIDDIWDSSQLTNGGKFVRALENQLKDDMDAAFLYLVSSGTIALQLSIEALGITSGEIITTPFSYVATTSAVLWQRCTPVFVDIDDKTFCIDPDKIENAINENTKAILPVHVYGNICDVEKINEIAKKHNLPVIYDAAHAFNTSYNGGCVSKLGDINVFSFHATKLFHTCEGGAIVLGDENLADRVKKIRSFGHFGDKHYCLGINAKMSELHAAMGLSNIKYIDEIIAKRKLISDLYDALLRPEIKRPLWNKGCTRNYSYYPIVLESEYQLKCIIDLLKVNNIHIRRYFYPSLNTLHYLEKEYKCPISEKISSNIVCLPLSPYMNKNDVLQVVKGIEEVLKSPCY